MAAPKGNQFWEERRDHGRKKIYETPQDLWNAAVDYFQWVQETPLYRSEVVKFQGKASLKDVPVMRAMTEWEFVEHSLIKSSTWDNYCSGEEPYKDFLGVTTRIKDCIKNQKFQGAAADLLNANIIARDLRLVDKTEVATKLTDATNEELENIIKGLQGARNARDYPDTPE